MRVHVGDDVGLVCAHQAQHFDAEVGEAIAPHDAGHAAVVVPKQVEGVLVVLDVGVRAAVGLEVLPQHARTSGGDGCRIDQWSQGVVEREEEAVALRKDGRRKHERGVEKASKHTAARR